MEQKIKTYMSYLSALPWLIAWSSLIGTTLIVPRLIIWRLLLESADLLSSRSQNSHALARPGLVVWLVVRLVIPGLRR
jgi:hypothetical protein